MGASASRGMGRVIGAAPRPPDYRGERWREGSGGEEWKPGAEAVISPWCARPWRAEPSRGTRGKAFEELDIWGALDSEVDGRPFFWPDRGPHVMCFSGHLFVFSILPQRGKKYPPPTFVINSDMVKSKLKMQLQGQTKMCSITYSQYMLCNYQAELDNIQLSSEPNSIR